jgi:hypothetical protein
VLTDTETALVVQFVPASVDIWKCVGGVIVTLISVPVDTLTLYVTDDEFRPATVELKVCGVELVVDKSTLIVCADAYEYAKARQRAKNVKRRFMVGSLHYWTDNV